MSTRAVDLPVDLNGEDDSGLPWGLISRARDPQELHVGAWIVVGSARTQALAQVVDIDGDVVHVRPLRGSVPEYLGTKGPGGGRTVYTIDGVDPSDLAVVRAALALLDERSEARSVLTGVVDTLARGTGVVLISSAATGRTEQPR